MKQVEIILSRDMDVFTGEVNKTLMNLDINNTPMEDIQYQFIFDETDNKYIYTALIIYSKA